MGDNTTTTTIENTKKLDKFQIVQIVLLVVALVLTVLGLVRYTDVNRLIIYGGQALFSVLIFVFGVLKFKDGDGRIFKYVLYAYALLQALRVVLLGIIGVRVFAGDIARYILVLIACTCVLIAERLGTEAGRKTAFFLVGLEVLLYIVFLVGFPGVLLGQLNKFMPLVGILIAVSIALTQKKSE